MWAAEFLFDATADGGVLKILTVTGEYTKCCLFLTAARRDPTPAFCPVRYLATPSLDAVVPHAVSSAHTRERTDGKM